MSLDRATREKLVRALAESVIQHVDELTSLDQAIGDGDHGLNMKRGALAIQAKLPELESKSINKARWPDVPSPSLPWIARCSGCGTLRFTPPHCVRACDFYTELHSTSQCPTGLIRM